MFVFSKIFLFFAMPATWLGILLVTGTALLWTRWHRAGRVVLTGTVGFIALITIFPAGEYLVEKLENRFPPVRQLSAPITGIVVLGGSVHQGLTQARGQPALKEGAERLTEAVYLSRKFPEAKIVFTGGSGSVLYPDLKEAETAKLFFARMGLPPDRLVFESESRNTWENALLTKKLLQPDKNERWVLITSASHMPRSIGVFRKIGWNIIPYPVDYGTYGDGDYRLGTNFVGGIADFSFGLREWLGLAVYRLLGRSDEFFPAPAPE